MAQGLVAAFRVAANDDYGETTFCGSDGVFDRFLDITTRPGCVAVMWWFN